MKIFRTDPDRFGIRARLLILLLPVMVGLLALDSWNDYRALQNLVQDAYDQAMLETVTALRNDLSLGPDGSLQANTPTVVSQTFEASSPQHKHVYASVTPHGQHIGASEQGATPQRERLLLGQADLPKPPLTGRQQSTSAGPATLVWYDSHYRGDPVRVVAQQTQVTDGHGQRFDLLIQVAENTRPRDEARAATLQQQLLRDLRMVLVVIFLVWLGVTWSLQPLERLRKSVLDNRGQALQPLDTTDVPHEVAPLVRAVNQHVASYRDLLDQQSQFLADASHQLRTPLAIMLTQAGVALREKDPTLLRETLRAMVTQISRSRRLCEQLLSLANASDSTATETLPEVVDLRSIAREVVLQYLALAHEKNQDLGWMDATAPEAQNATDTGAAAARLEVLAAGAELHEALSNLVHNAIAYTPPGGRITVRAAAQEGRATVEILDSGPGIEPGRREVVFKRFRQGGQRTEKGLQGAGLGLAIARAYARRNGGDITLTDLPADEAGSTSGLHGLRAILSLPLATG